jgi:hypothetical protein
MSILTNFVAVSRKFPKHRKTKRILKQYPKEAKSVLWCLFLLWIEGQDYYTDGVLKMDGDDIEEMLEWDGEPGRFIEIVTHKKTRFLDKITDDEYHIHNWLKWNPRFSGKAKENKSEPKVIAGHKMHEGRERAMLDGKGLLEEDGSVVKECKWLDFKGEYGRLRVVFDKVPKYMNLEGEEFYTRAEFREVNENATVKQMDERIRKIKRHTKRCTECEKIFVDSSSSVCSGCQEL